jgi:spermidine synthase
MIQKTINLIIIIIIIILIIITVIYLNIIFIDKKFLYENFKIKKNVNFVDECDKTNINITYNNCKHLFSKKSKYQKIDVYNHETVGNILVIDDDLQITASDEKNYHEMIVHVPLNYIPDAKNVLIIGGGDGGTLTEVLKHKNLKTIINVEIDKEVINASKKYFPNIGNSFNDPKVIVEVIDAKQWVKNNILNVKMNNFFDVIILDLTDFGASESLITDEFFIDIKKFMKKKGILVLNYESMGWYKTNLGDFKKKMRNYFKNIYVYQVFQPTYHSGHYSFAFFSNTIDPINTVIDWKKYNNKKIKTNYYNKKIHYSSFSLPNKIIPNEKKLKNSLGLLVSFDIVCNNNVGLNNIENVNNFFDTVLKNFNLSEVDRIEHQFNPVGITMLSLLKESHLSIHTWPEYNSACIDIFTCGKFIHDSNKIKMESIIKHYFNTKKIRVKQIDREIDREIEIKIMGDK